MITQDFSGVVLNQNAVPANPTDNYPLSSNYLYQQFFLPLNYKRGTSSNEIIYPDISGFQILVDISTGDAPSASLNYTIDQYIFGSGWNNLTSGQTVGCHADGPQVWYDILLPNSITIQPGMVPTQTNSTQTEDLLRIGFSNVNGINSVWFTQPNPFAYSPNVMAVNSDQITPLLSPHGSQFSFNFRILGLVADSGIDLFGNPYRSAVVTSSADNTSTTSGQVTGFYLSPPQPSEFAVVSNYFDVRDANSQAVVIDSILIDPITPNPTVNIYFTNDPAGPGTDDTSWEQLLWTYVTTVQATRKNTFALPGPISAQYIKIEYTGLQAQTYNPGQFQAPVTYKKFPKWVADFFILQLEQPGFVANNVGVVYDALTFAYAYMLDDLQQSPAQPISAPNSVDQQVTNFFNTANDVSDQVDPVTLDKINLVLSTYQQPPGALGDTSTAAGNQARTIALSTTNYPVEGATVNLPLADYSDVSSLNKDSLVFEQGFPAMYFYLTCRHVYRQLSASFEYNRAYFVGINEIAFIRNNYTTTSDSSLYIESGNDTLNIDINDFSVDENGVWTIPSYTGPYVLNS